MTIEGPGPTDWATRPDAEPIPVTVEPNRRNDSVDLDADLPWDGFVVFNEATWTGWTAEVDGAPRPMLIANGLARAVEVPAGRHRIHFAFRTPGLVLSLAASLLTIALFLAWSAWQWPREATPPPHRSCGRSLG